MVSSENDNPSTSARLVCYFSSRHEKRYWKFISWALSLKRGLNKERGFHIHHIAPRCIGGSDTETNLVKLTIREHLFAHLLLAKMQISPLLVCAHSFMKKNRYTWTEEMSQILSELTKAAKADLDNSTPIFKGWETWKNQAEDYFSRFQKAWDTRRERGNDKITDFSPEATLKRKNAAKKANESKLSNPDFDGSTPVKRGWETRRAREAQMDPDLLEEKKRKSVEKCNATKQRNGTHKRSKESIEKQKKTNSMKKSKLNDIV